MAADGSADLSAGACWENYGRNRLFLVSVASAAMPPLIRVPKTSQPGRSRPPCWPLSASRKPPGWPRWILSASTDGFTLAGELQLSLERSPSQLGSRENQRGRTEAWGGWTQGEDEGCCRSNLLHLSRNTFTGTFSYKRVVTKIKPCTCDSSTGPGPGPGPTRRAPPPLLQGAGQGCVPD